MKLNQMNERQLLFERVKCDRGESNFSSEEINKEAFKKMKELAEVQGR